MASIAEIPQQPPPRVEIPIFPEQKEQAPPSSWFGTVSRSISQIPTNIYTGIKAGVKEVIPITFAIGIIADAMSSNSDGCSFFRGLGEDAIDRMIGISTEIPLVEEILFRGLLQKGILKPISKGIAYLVDPKQQNETVQKVAKFTPMILSTAIFSGVHIQNADRGASLAYAMVQVLTCLNMGWVASKLAESETGLAGAFGVHFINNFIGWLVLESQC